MSESGRDCGEKEVGAGAQGREATGHSSGLTGTSAITMQGAWESKNKGVGMEGAS